MIANPCTDAGRLVMPCGKYRGVPLSGLPIPYLKWVFENWDDPTLAENALRVMESRRGGGATITPLRKKHTVRRHPASFEPEHCVRGDRSWLTQPVDF